MKKIRINKKEIIISEVKKSILTGNRKEIQIEQTSLKNGKNYFPINISTSKIIYENGEIKIQGEISYKKKSFNNITTFKLYNETGIFLENNKVSLNHQLNYKQNLISIWKYLFNHKIVTSQDLPIYLGHTRYAANTKPIDRKGKKMFSPHKISKNFFIETNMSGKEIKNQIKHLCNNYISKSEKSIELEMNKKGIYEFKDIESKLDGEMKRVEINNIQWDNNQKINMDIQDIKIIKEQNKIKKIILSVHDITISKQIWDIANENIKGFNYYNGKLTLEKPANRKLVAFCKLLIQKNYIKHKDIPKKVKSQVRYLINTEKRHVDGRKMINPFPIKVNQDTFFVETNYNKKRIKEIILSLVDELSR